MSEYDSLADFLSHCEPPLLSVRGYEVHVLTYAGKGGSTVTAYPVLKIDDAEVIATGIDLSEAVEHIITAVCMSLIKEVQV